MDTTPTQSKTVKWNAIEEAFVLFERNVCGKKYLRNTIEEWHQFGNAPTLHILVRVCERNQEGWTGRTHRTFVGMQIVDMPVYQTKCMPQKFMSERIV